MNSNSLAFRLMVSSAIVAVILLALAAVLLSGLFQSALERNFDARLRAAIDALSANVEPGTDGTPILTGTLADNRFAIADSGWYWQVVAPKQGMPPLLSASRLNEPLPVAAADRQPRDENRIAAFSMLDEKGTQLRAIEQKVTYDGSPGEYSFMVTGNFDELKDEVSAFRNALYITLGLLGAGLLGAISFQVNFGLKPLKHLQKRINDIRGGRIEMLESDYPSEIQPVADELNLLVQANIEVIDRARMQVGNLAHALKTPISVLTNEARDAPGNLSEKVKEQVEVMRDQVNLYLDRARRAARAQSIGAVTEVESVLQSLGRTLERINRDKGVAITITSEPGLKFRGERQDLEEIVGNLMDNACKWCKSKVEARGRLLPTPGEDGRRWLDIEVDDDGPGLRPEQRATALKRGQRLDESKPGSGLGLNIVTETAAMYGGRVELDDAKLGGLRVRLRLPAVG
jgi:signal transduction histidine kinase